MFSGCSELLKNKIRNQNLGIKENAFKNVRYFYYSDESSIEIEDALFPLYNEQKQNISPINSDSEE